MDCASERDGVTSDGEGEIVGDGDNGVRVHNVDDERDGKGAFVADGGDGDADGVVTVMIMAPMRASMMIGMLVVSCWWC